MLIQSPDTPTSNQPDTALTPADSGKVLQNPQPPRNQDQVLPPCYKTDDEDDQ
jgi:hypothetical protein